MLPNLPVLSPPIIDMSFVRPVEQLPPPILYTIKDSDVLENIALEQHTTVQRLFDKNTSIIDPNVIETGQTLVIPAVDEVLADRPMPAIVEEPTQAKLSTTPSPSVNAGGFLSTYQKGQCTAWVASHRYVPNGWGDATNWKSAAKRAGWTISATPVPGAIGWTYGHVVLVVSVSDGKVVISEANYDWHGSIRTITVPTSKYTYLYN